MIEIVPFKQTDNSRCGPASIKMILSYYGIEASEDEICERCGHTYELGCTNVQMVEALESYGLISFIEENSSFEEIEHWLSQGYPVIVDWFSPGDPLDPTPEMPNGHASVVVDLDIENITLIDPEIGGLRKIKREEFMRVWFDWVDDLYLTANTPILLRLIIVALNP